MTTLLDAIGTKLQTDGVGTLGTDIFLSTMPETPDAIVAVYEYAGTSPDFTMGAGLYAIDHPNIQIRVRGARESYVTTAAKARAARDSLASVANTTLSGIAVARFSPNGSLNPLGMDANDRSLFTINFSVWVL
jgi:hypothetical protein